MGREWWWGEEAGRAGVVGGEVEEEERGAAKENGVEGEESDLSRILREKRGGRMRKGSMAPRRSSKLMGLVAKNQAEPLLLKAELT